MDAAYKQNEMQAYRITVQLEQILKKEWGIPTEGWQQRLKDIEQQIQTKKFRMAVVGEFNRGKSSLINVLLGRKILPEDVLASTATINRVTYGETPKAYLIMKDDDRRSQEIPVEDLASYVTKLTESSAKTAAGIREAVIEYPTILCYNDVDLIDTPGMNDMDDMNAVTISQLEDIDLAVVAVDAQYPYSETENRFVVKLLESRMICQIIFVITHFDMIRDREKQKLYHFLYSRIQKNVLEELNKNYQPKDRIFQKYHAVFDNLHLYGVSSPDAMEALESNDMKLYEKSGFLRLSKELPQVILSSQSIHMVDNIVTLLEEVIGEYEAEIKKVNDVWEQLCTFKQSCIFLFEGVLRTLDELTADGFCDSWYDNDELITDDLIKKFLDSLGSVRVFTYPEIQKAMNPVIQQESERMNQYYQFRRQDIIDHVMQEWHSALSRLADSVKGQIQKCPQLSAGIQAENNKIFALPYRQFAEKLVKSDLQEQSLDQPSKPCIFAWSESLVQAVFDTEENQSVLPQLQRIVRQSIDTSSVEMEYDLKTAFSGQIAEVKKDLDAYIESLNTYIDRQKHCRRDDTILLSDLRELQGECKILHERIAQVNIQKEKGYRCNE